MLQVFQLLFPQSLDFYSSCSACILLGVRESNKFQENGTFSKNTLSPFNPLSFFPPFQTCSCSWSFSLSRLLFLMAPSLKCLVVSKVTCHRRSRNQTCQSSLPCIYTNTDNLLSNGETPGDHQTLLHSWECFCLPWHTRTSGVRTGLSVKLQHPTPKRLFLLWHRGWQSDIAPLAKPTPGTRLWGQKARYVQQRNPGCRISAVLPKPEFTKSQSNVFWIKCLLA